MGNCCNYAICNRKIVPSYEIILKVPHGKTCFQVINNKWTLKSDINKQLQKCFKDIFLHWIVYNDETPLKTNSNGAHAKGILAWNKTTIVWLIHSVPKFPKEFNGTDSFPDIDPAELKYGQSFLFLKLGIEHLEHILKQLFIMQPNIYISNFNYDLYKVLYKQNKYNIYKISDNLQHVAKSPKYHVDLYEEVLIPSFGGQCCTETWVRGHDYLDTDRCKMIHSISFPDNAYTYTQDHSKYCYSDNGWIMIGDLNRMTSQEKRGGGGVVIHNNTTTKLFKEIIVTDN